MNGGKEDKKMKYRVVVNGGLVTVGYAFESDSRNSKKHLTETGANHCAVYAKNGVQVSAATRWGDGTITNVSF